ncbi:MAG: SRPBCC domain-containing protein [Erysipelotrichaceae bacterium]|nr:SRPBCC domain-containing protein [Erysipelotrichaceae bacterium]MDP3305880.1 SRPBCC domain-containing protein [Erysipelotrichaceae bacterium]
MKRKNVTVQTIVNAPIEQVWKCWIEPKHIEQWNAASDDWHTPKAVNDVREGGRFVYTMAAKDGSVSFDFNGTFEEIIESKKIITRLDDDRRVWVTFEERDHSVQVVETFEIEDENTEELQRSGWQAILDNFKKYVESL